MFKTRSIYEPLVKLCKELINEKKALIEESEGLKETLRCIRQDNQELREKLFSKTKDEKLDALEKRVAYLEDRLSPVELGVKMAEEKLQRYKWYNSTEFTKDELLKKLGTGVLVEVILDPFKDNKGQDPEETEVKTVRVHYIVRNIHGETMLSIGELYYRQWFRVI